MSFLTLGYFIGIQLTIKDLKADVLAPCCNFCKVLFSNKNNDVLVIS